MGQKDILEKLNEIAIETNWGTAERVNGIPKAVIVIQEAMEEIKRLREQRSELLQGLYNYAQHETKDEDNGFALACYQLRDKVVAVAKRYGVKIEKNE